MDGTRIRAMAIGMGVALLTGALVAQPALGAEDTAAAETTVAIPSEAYDIPGVLALPADAVGPVPAVLMLHGYGSTADEVGDMYGRLAESLAAHGIGSLRVDFAGMGASAASTLDYTYDSMVSDAAAALDWLVGEESTDPERIGVQGFSMGSMIGSHLVGTDSRPIAFGSWSGAIDNYNPVTGQAESLEACEATGEGHLELDLGWRTIDHSCEYFSSMMGGTALTDFAPYAGALLLVAGSDDVVVPPSVSENAATASASEDVTLEIIEGADHIYHVLTEDQTLADQAISMTADWYAEKL